MRWTIIIKRTHHSHFCNISVQENDIVPVRLYPISINELLDYFYSVSTTLFLRQRRVCRRKKLGGWVSVRLGKNSRRIAAIWMFYRHVLLRVRPPCSCWLSRSTCLALHRKKDGVEFKYYCVVACIRGWLNEARLASGLSERSLYVRNEKVVAESVGVGSGWKMKNKRTSGYLSCT